MSKLASLATAAAVLITGLVTSASTASAQPVTRDHRSGPPPAVNGPSHNHRARSGHYRRRPGPRFMLPMRIDIGAIGANTDRGFLSGIEAKVGVHWASLSPEPTDFDIGIGVMAAVLPGPENGGSTSDDSVVYAGGYLEVGQTLSRGDYWRTWAAGRGEYFARDSFGQEDEGFGLAGRLGAEVYVSGVGIEPRGVFLGTYALGVYLEAGARQLGDDVSKVQVAAGVSLRTPLVFGP